VFTTNVLPLVPIHATWTQCLQFYISFKSTVMLCCIPSKMLEVRYAGGDRTAGSGSCWTLKNWYSRLPTQLLGGRICWFTVVWWLNNTKINWSSALLANLQVLLIERLVTQRNFVKQSGSDSYSKWWPRLSPEASKPLII